MAQFKMRRGTKEGGSTARGGKRGAARQQGCRTVGSQSVNLTLNVNVSGGRTPGTPPPDAALCDATDGTDCGKHGNNTNNAVDWFDSNCCPLP